MGAFAEEGVGASNLPVRPTHAQAPPHLFLPTESLKVVALLSPQVYLKITAVIKLI